MAIHEKKLAVIGSSAEILKLAHPTTRILDAGGCVVPLPAGTSVGSSIRISVGENGAIVVDSGEEDTI